MKTVLKILGGTAIFIVLLIFGLIVFVNLAWDRTFEAPYPDISAIEDSTAIARGKYLAFGPAHCATCHVPVDQIKAVDEGAIIPLSGWVGTDHRSRDI